MAKKRYLSAYAFALTSVGLGDNEEAFAWLARAHRECSSAIPFVGVEPRLEPLHSDPRFREILARVGLEPRTR